jgi:hypothetical protein
LMSSPSDPWLLLTVISFASDLAILCVLLGLLPTTAKTSHVRHVLRFALIWSVGAIGVQWSLANGQEESILMIVSGIVSLVAMTLMPGLWTQLAWRTVLDLKDHKDVKTLDNYQIAIYVGALVFIGFGFTFRDGYAFLAEPFKAIFQAFFISCLAWSVSRVLGPGYGSSSDLEKRSRTFMAAGTAAMLFFVLIDLLQALTLKVHTELASGLQFIPMALIGGAFLMMRKFMVSPSAKVAKASRTLGHGTHLRPGRVYLEIGDRPGVEVLSPSDILRSQVRQGRPVMLVTNKDPKRYLMVPKLQDLPVVHFVPESAEGKDLTSEEVLEMVSHMAKEFALEAWMLDISENKDRGAVVIIDGLSVLHKTAGKDGTKEFLKALRQEVRGSDQLAIVLFGDGSILPGLAKTLKKYTRPLGKGKAKTQSNR